MTVTHHTSSQATVTLTPAAIEHILIFLAKEKANTAVRFGVKKTGCSGYSYVVEPAIASTENDIILSLNKDYFIYIDKTSFPFLKGMQIDYRQQGLNAKFVFNNPNQKGECGCGESFTVDEIE